MKCSLFSSSLRHQLVKNSQCRSFSHAAVLQHTSIPPHIKAMADNVNQDIVSSDSGAAAKRIPSNVSFNDARHRSPELDRLRVMPKHASFYMTNPMHEEHMKKLNDLLQKYINVPRDESALRPKWLSQEQYAIIAGGTRLKNSHYSQFLKLANRLAKIDPQLMPDDVANALAYFTVDKDASVLKKRYPTVDENGVAKALGRRKNSAAHVYIARSSESVSGQVLVNGRSLESYFPRIQDRHIIMYPLSVVAAEQSFNIFATVRGGGPTGQSGAIANALAKALVIQNPLFRTKLTRAKCIQPDIRVVERKKPGKPKARKAFTWVKR